MQITVEIMGKSCRPMTYRTQSNSSIPLKIPHYNTQHKVPFINTSETIKKGQVTEQRTANVQMPRTVAVA